MNVLKIATAGSVDDGKSTLIGRLLYDTHSLTEDKLQAIAESSRKKGFDYLDFSLATDGLVAEREQGITIDVAHIYFSTPSRSYIVADTPGHVEYTRNMVTGASTSQAAIILIDARKGVVEQTYRHFFINNLLRVKEVIVAVNKMDLVDYEQEVFEGIRDSFDTLNKNSTYDQQRITYIPVSALQGDNVVRKSGKMAWYTGPSLLQYLEGLDLTQLREDSGTARFPVQLVIRPKTNDFHDFRAYAGKLYGGSLRPKDEVTILPSGTRSRIKEVFFFDRPLSEAVPGSSITITLEDDVNLVRGDMIVKSSEKPVVRKELRATICWMDQKPLRAGARYTLQHHSNKVTSKIISLDNTVATDYSGHVDSPEALGLNEIGEVQIRLAQPIYYDDYTQNKENGTFILIDPQTHHTAAVGFLNT
jgi:sulfate adenylyltransferase subunit 1